MSTAKDEFWVWIRAALDDETEDRKGVRLGSTPANSLGTLQLAFEAGAEWGEEQESERNQLDSLEEWK